MVPLERFDFITTARDAGGRVSAGRLSQGRPNADWLCWRIRGAVRAGERMRRLRL